jgi:hypothetical protein
MLPTISTIMYELHQAKAAIEKAIAIAAAPGAGAEEAQQAMKEANRAVTPILNACVTLAAAKDKVDDD